MGSSARLRLYMNDNGPLILDGGLATELEAQGAKLQGDPLWSARLLHTNPQAIRDAHHRLALNLIESTSLKEIHLGLGDFTISVLRLLFFSSKEFKVWHRPQIDCLAAAGADLLAFETIPSIKEAEALIELLREFPNSQAWLSFSCKDGTCISDGSSFSEAVQMANRCTQLVAVGVNCCSPALVEPLLQSARLLLSPDMSWVVYPNSGEDWDSEQGWLTSEKTSASISELGHTWMKQGAALIGGCCRIGPAHIAELRRELKGSCTSPSSAV
uniref:homocysteine S-methyltransferase 3 n=1 Tax=Epinephelus lanceolatus TaxID=310571 RepID=UPI001444BACE|nr:homocysteine S-methyltransferase 3 [Epinephelus lanceolatus]